MGVLGSIFYKHNVVGGVVYCTNDIYGGGIHRTRRYGCEHMHIQFQKYIQNFKYAKKEPAFADSYIKQYDLRGIFDESIIQFLFVSK